jgi:hypothetical protein
VTDTHSLEDLLHVSNNDKYSLAPRENVHDSRKRAERLEVKQTQLNCEFLVSKWYIGMRVF